MIDVWTPPFPQPSSCFFCTWNCPLARLLHTTYSILHLRPQVSPGRAGLVRRRGLIGWAGGGTSDDARSPGDCAAGARDAGAAERAGRKGSGLVAGLGGVGGKRGTGTGWRGGGEGRKEEGRGWGGAGGGEEGESDGVGGEGRGGKRAEGLDGEGSMGDGGRLAAAWSGPGRRVPLRTVSLVNPLWSSRGRGRA